MGDDEHFALFCHRCARQVHPGRGDFYVIRLEAFADPTPPELSEEDLARGAGDLDEQIERLIEQMKDMSPQELADQVYRRMTIHLCTSCYRDWIEDPAAGSPPNDG